MIPVVFAAVLSTIHLEADVTSANGDYVEVPFEVPAGTVEFEVARTVTPADVVLDFGVWGPDGFRGWGGGLTEPTTIGVSDSSRGYLPGAIAPGTWKITVGKARLPAGTAHYAMDVTFRDAATLVPRARAKLDQTVLESGERWYRGDLHVHDTESGDAGASINQVIALARQRHLDFVVFSDHNTVSQDGLIAALQANVQDLLLVRGIEVTTYGGHGGAFGASTYVDHRIGLNGRTAAQMIEDVNAQGALFVVNHPVLDLGTACIGCAWRHADTPWSQVAALEIETGNYPQWRSIFQSLTLQFWDTQLDAGARLAAVGGSDDHRAGMDTGASPSEIGSPTTLVWTDELSESSLIDGIRAGRTQVALRGPDDPVVDLTTADGKKIGDALTGNQVAVTAHVAGGNGFTLALVVNGAEVQRAKIDTDDWMHPFTVEVPQTGGRLRAHLVDEGGDAVVITSHLWLTWAPGMDSGGCSVAGPAGRSWAVLALVLLAGAALLVRRRAR